ncbi:phage major capsid protein [Pirellulaceae bacterium SH467]
MSMKELYDKRNKLVSDAKSFLEQHGESWTFSQQHEYDRKLAEIKSLTEEIKDKEEKRAKAGFHVSGPLNYDPAEPFTRTRNNKMQSNENVIFHQGQSIAAHFGCDPSMNIVGNLICAQAGRDIDGDIQAVIAGTTNQNGNSVLKQPHFAGMMDHVVADSTLTNAGAGVLMMKSETVTIGRIESKTEFESKPELESFTRQKMKFGHVGMRSFTIGAVYETSKEFLQDAVNAPQIIEKTLAADFAEQIDKYGIQGTGEKEPLGLANNTAIASTGGGAVDWLDFSAASTTIRGFNREPNACVLTPTLRDALWTIETGDGTTAARGWLSPPKTLENVRFLASNNAHATVGVIGDFSQALIGIRLGMEIITSDQAGDTFENYAVLIRAVWRGDFAVIDPKAFHRLTGLTAT